MSLFNVSQISEEVIICLASYIHEFLCQHTYNYYIITRGVVGAVKNGI